MTIVEFLLARIAEDEAELPCLNCGRSLEPDGPREEGELGHVAAADPASDFWEDPCPDPKPVPRALAECEAKRRIVDRCAPLANTQVRRQTRTLAGDAIREFANIYADHPDFREEWRP